MAEKKLRIFLSGEMITDDALKSRIPLNPNADIDALKEGDADPLDIVIRTAFRSNKKGWEYTDAAFNDIVTHILTSKILVPSHLGHQDGESVNYEFRDIVASVVGALKDVDYVYYRIVIDQDAKKLKRWIRNKQVGEVSIWGFPAITIEGGITKVVGYNLISIDFTPPGRSGQTTEIVSAGEINDQSFEKTRDEIQSAVREKYQTTYPNWVWINETYDTFVIVQEDGAGKYYRIPYTQNESGITLGDAEEVRRVVSYEKISGEKEVRNMELDKVSTDELLAELKARNTEGRIAAKIAGEMDLVLEDPKAKQDGEQAKAELAKIKEAAGEMDPVEAIKYGIDRKAADAKAESERVFGEMVAAVKKEKAVTAEQEKWISKIGRLAVGMTREQVAGEIDRVLSDEDVKAAIGKAFAQVPVGFGKGAPDEAIAEV